jgi:hypothetical protein
MFNIKWGGIAAGVAFALALLLSLILGQTSLPIALFRAVVFAALFFGLGIAAWTLINTFIPDLLSSNTGDIAAHLFSTGSAGSRVNITVDDSQNAALPEQERGATGSGEVGDFNELFTPKEDSQDIDQIPTTGYTEEGETGEFAAVAGEFGVETEEFASVFNDDSLNVKGEGEAEGEGEDEAGEFSMDFSAFVPGGLDGGDGSESDGEADESDSGLDSFSFFPDGASSGTLDEPPPERKVSRNKPMKLEGDFNAKEIAAGLRTVLEKDKK